MSDVIKDDGARHVVSFSGGKDSTALGIYLLQEYPQIPLEFIFCDTGSELNETYEYIKRFEVIFGVQVKFLNALDFLGIEKKENRSPFEVYLKEIYGGFLPSPKARWCTRVLKIQPFEREIGTDKTYSYIGIRADENRGGYHQNKNVVLSEAQNIFPVYPFKEFGLGLEDVKAILNDSGLGLPPYYKWRSRSGCYFCFYQQIGEWQGLKEHHPDLFKKAQGYEKSEGDRNFSWVEGRTLEELEKITERYEIPKGEDLEGCAICSL